MRAARFSDLALAICSRRVADDFENFDVGVSEAPSY